MGCLGLTEAQDSNDERFYGGVHFGEQNKWGVDVNMDFSKYSSADELLTALGEIEVRRHLRGIIFGALGEHVDLREGAELLMLHSLRHKIAIDLAGDEKW